VAVPDAPSQRWQCSAGSTLPVPLTGYGPPITRAQLRHPGNADGCGTSMPTRFAPLDRPRTGPNERTRPLRLGREERGPISWRAELLRVVTRSVWSSMNVTESGTFLGRSATVRLVEQIRVDCYTGSGCAAAAMLAPSVRSNAMMVSRC
jgi:hypothetical protein